MFELQRKLDGKNEIIQLMRRKHVTNQREKMTLTTSSDHPFKLVVSDQSMIINPGEKDSGLEMTQSKIQLINGIMGSQNSHDAADETKKEDMAEDNVLEENEGKGAERKETEMEMIYFDKSDADKIEEEIEQMAKDLANEAILKGVQHLTNEREIKMRSEMESLTKKLESAEEDNISLQQQALELNAKMDESKKERQQALQDMEMLQKQLNDVKELKDEEELLNEKAFHEKVEKMKIKNDQLNQDLKEALQDKQKADEDMKKMKKIQEANEAEREREFGELCSKMKIEQDALKKKAEDLQEDFRAQKDEGEEILMKYFSLENKLSKLQETQSKTLADFAEEKKLKEEESILNNELASNMASLMIEKANLAAENMNLTMEKNQIEIRNKEIEKVYQEQEILLQKAQNSLREMMEEDHQRRLRKRRRRGWRKLKFWR